MSEEKKENKGPKVNIIRIKPKKKNAQLIGVISFIVMSLFLTFGINSILVAISKGC